MRKLAKYSKIHSRMTKSVDIGGKIHEVRLINKGSRREEQPVSFKTYDTRAKWDHLAVEEEWLRNNTHMGWVVGDFVYENFDEAWLDVYGCLPSQQIKN